MARTDELSEREEILFKNLLTSHWVNIIQVTLLGLLIVFIAWRQSTSERLEDLIQVVAKIEHRVVEVETILAVKTKVLDQCEVRLAKLESGIEELKQIIANKSNL